MKTIKHNITGLLLILSVALFSQIKSQKSTEMFSVNDDVIVEIDTHYSNVKVEFWDEKAVYVEYVLEIDGVSSDEADSYFDAWNIEVLGNSKKVTITSEPNFSFAHGDFDFSELNIVIPEMDFEPIIAYSFKFDSVSYPTPPEMPVVVIEQLDKIEWNQEAYEKDKEKYLKEFEAKQQKWAKEFEENLEPQMVEFEMKMEKWEKEFKEKYEPQMQEYEEKMAVWATDFEKNFEPQMKDLERKIEVKVKALKSKIDAKSEKSKKMKKTILIKIPKSARVDVNSHKGSVKLPKGVNKI